MMIPENEKENFEAFVEALSISVVAKLSAASTPGPRKRRATKGRKNEIKPVEQVRTEKEENDDVAGLREFVEYLGDELFTSLPDTLRSITYAMLQEFPTLADEFSLPPSAALVSTVVTATPPSAVDSLSTYNLIPSSSDLANFLAPILTQYITSATTAPPAYAPSLPSSCCEICDRSHIPLTYHHLIPRQMHAKAVKRGWHQEWELQKVAWLCRACHSFVHRIATNEELARDFHNVDALLDREDVRKFAAWVGRVRWKAR